jgi:serine/threonine protein kinase
VIHVNRGGYSTVYEVTSKATNERCAVKCIEKRILEKGRNIKLLRRYSTSVAVVVGGGCGGSC